MPRFPERRYPDNEARERARELAERGQQADREAAGLFYRQMAEMDLAATGLVDLNAGESLEAVEVDENGQEVAVVSRED